MQAKRDENRVPTLLAVSSSDGTTPVTLYADPTTHRLYVDLPGGGAGTVTDVSVVTANGISGTVATSTTTPAITLSLGNITPTSIAIPSTGTGISLYNTVDQTTNYERVVSKWDTNTFYLLSEQGGTGTTRPIQIGDSNNLFKIDGSGPYKFTFNRVGGTSNNIANITGLFTGSSTTQIATTINPNVTQSGTAGYTALLINPTETSTGSGTKRLISAQVGGVDKFVVDNTGAVTATSLIVGALTGTASGNLPLAGGTMSGNITLGENTSIALDPAGSADGKYTGITVTGVAGYTQAFGDLVYLAVADSRWELADADASATAGPVALAMVVVPGTDGNACTLLLQGIIRADAKFPTMTVGATQFVGETAGAIQGTIPTGADNVVRTVGYALTADELYFNPSTDFQLTVA